MKNTIIADIWTPYLDEELSKQIDENEEKKIVNTSYFRKELGIYAPGHTPTLKKGYETPMHQVEVRTKVPDSRGEFADYFAGMRSGEIEKPDIIIAGSTQWVESCVENARDLDLLVARYSIFYKRPNGYTYKHPEEAGYALDIPKSPSTAVDLLTNDGFLSAIKEKDVEMLKNSLNDMKSPTHRLPVLLTEYLPRNYK